MSYDNPLGNLLSTDHPDVTLARLGLVLSVVLFALQFLASQPYLVVIPLSTGSACILYLVTANRRVTSVAIPTLPRLAAGYLPSFVVLCLAVFVVLVKAAGQRTVPAYLLAGAIGAFILGQVLLLDDERLSVPTILAQILGAAVVIRLAGLFVTPGFVGVDIWTHVPVYVEGIASSGSLSAIAESKYVMAPIYHVYGAIGAHVFGSGRLAVYLTLGLLIPLSVLFVYGAGRLLLPARWALLATALYAFADQFIRWGLHVSTTSVGLVFFLAIVYCVTRLFIEDAEPWVIGLMALFSLAVVFTHQVSTAIVLAFLGIATGVALSVDLSRGFPFWVSISRKARALLAIFAATLVVTIASWAHTPYRGSRIFLWRTLEFAERALAERAGFLNLASEPETPPPVPPEPQTGLDALVPFVELAGFGLLLSAAVVGGLVILRWDKPAYASLTYLVTAAAFFVAVFGFSLFGFRAFLPGRWISFLYVLMAIMAAVGLYYVFQTASNRVILAVVVLLALGYPTSMVVAEKATLDNPAFDDRHPRFSYTDSELAALETIHSVHPPAIATGLHTDHPYKKLFERPVGGYEAQTLQLGAEAPASDDPIVYRDYQSTGPVSFLIPDAGPTAFYTRSAPATTICRPDRNVVYSNDRVRLCLPATGPTGGGGA